MKTNKLFTTLTELGLKEKEAKVYLANLSLGPTTILQIARFTELKRTTVYSIIESLKQKSLINIEVKGFKKLFTAENPERLKSILEEKTSRLKNSLPEFLALYNLKGGESFIKYYEGKKSIKIVYESLLEDVKPHEDYLVIGAQQEWYNLDPEYFQDFIVRRAKLNINIRLLMQDSKIAREHKKMERIYNEKIKNLPKETQLTTNLVIIPKKIVIHQLAPPIIIIMIENKSIIQMHRELFEIIWKAIPD
ncbi:MAG: helix-turn-helix domain-containing protein [Patescibacteria group bacterium]